VKTLTDISVKMAENGVLRLQVLPTPNNAPT
jgi:hypothetical protein